MRSLRLAAAVVLLGAATACGGGAQPAPVVPDGPPAASSASPSALPDGTTDPGVDDETAVRTAFTEYNDALAASDAAAACARSAPETVATLVAAVSQQLGQQVEGCEDAFGLVFATPGAAELARETAASTEIRQVSVDGDTAVVEWSADVQGQPATQTNELVRIDGRWLLGGIG